MRCLVTRWTPVLDTLVAVAALFVALRVEVRPGLLSLGGLLYLPLSLWSAFLLIAVIALWPGALIFAGAYDRQQLKTIKAVVIRTAIGCALGSLLAQLLLFSGMGTFNSVGVATMWGAATAGSLAVRALTWLASKICRSLRAPLRVVIVGVGRRGAQTHDRVLSDPFVPVTIVAFVDPDPDVAGAAHYMNVPILSLAQLEELLDVDVVDEVHIALPIKSRYDEFQQTLALCERVGVTVAYSLDVFTHSTPSVKTVAVPSGALTRSRVVGASWELVAKRLVDIALASAAIVALSPLMLAIAALVRLTSRGPALFKQRRYGQYKRLFTMYKFRTMRIDAEQVLRADAAMYAQFCANGYKLATDVDPRLTPIGRFLRTTSLDELPQLWNVLVGDMAIIGPRPILLDEIGQYGATASTLLALKPGLTGAWVAAGRSSIQYPRRAELELGYVRGWSVRSDLQIFLRTIPALLLRRGAQ